MVGRKINQAKLSNCTEVWVSTDDPEIAKVSKNYGARVIDRPEELSTDESGTDEMLMHAISQLECGESDILVLLQPTSPLLEISSIDKCIKMLVEDKKLSSVITIKEGHPFMWESADRKFWNPAGHTRTHRPRRQELGIGGWETGGCYAIRAKSLQEQCVRYPSPTNMVNVSYLEAIDVDTQDDLDVVRHLLNLNIPNALRGSAAK